MKKKIMVVDDNPMVILTVKTGLQDVAAAQYDVIEATSGKTCFELLKKGDIPDLILLDIMMPGMDGWEVQRILKENQAWRNIPVIFLTAVADKTSKKIGQIIGKDFIEKPFDIVDVKNRIDIILRS